jgi:hypothetical protein
LNRVINRIVWLKMVLFMISCQKIHWLSLTISRVIFNSVCTNNISVFPFFIKLSEWKKQFPSPGTLQLKNGLLSTYVNWDGRFFISANTNCWTAQFWSAVGSIGRVWVTCLSLVLSVS